MVHVEKQTKTLHSQSEKTRLFAFSLFPQFDSVILTAFNLNFVSELGRSSCRRFTPVFIRVTPALHTTAANCRAAHIQYSNKVSILRWSGPAGSQVVSCAFQKMTSPCMESEQGPVHTAGVNKVRGLYWNHCLCVHLSVWHLWNGSTFQNQTWDGGALSWTGECHQMAFYLKGKGHSERSHNWNVIVSFELQLLLQPNLVW